VTAPVRQLAADVVVDAKATLGEGPTWDAAGRRLVWLDIVGCRLHVTDPATGTDTAHQVEQEISIALPAGDGRYVVGVRQGIGLFDTTSSSLTVTHPFVAEGLRMNDGKCDRTGRLWAGTMAFGAKPNAGSLYRLDADGTITTMVRDLTISNGMAWSPDDRSFYFIDTMTGGIDVFDFDPASGAIDNRRRLFDVAPNLGYPDGMTIDAEGHLWIAFWDGAAVRRFSPTGELEAEVRVPCDRPTSCVFGDDDLATLYITSARDELSDEQLAAQPLAGAVFAVRPGVTGTPSPFFAGDLAAS
jgi:sugar lactone lactonase YvrE